MANLNLLVVEGNLPNENQNFRCQTKSNANIDQTIEFLMQKCV